MANQWNPSNSRKCSKRCSLYIVVTFGTLKLEPFVNTKSFTDISHNPKLITHTTKELILNLSYLDSLNLCVYLVCVVTFKSIYRMRWVYTIYMYISKNVGMSTKFFSLLLFLLLLNGFYFREEYGSNPLVSMS